MAKEDAKCGFALTLPAIVEKVCDGRTDQN